MICYKVNILFIIICLTIKNIVYFCNMSYEKKCLVCGNVYIAKRSDSKTCSSSCRVKYHFIKANKEFVGYMILSRDSKTKKVYYNMDQLTEMCKDYNWCHIYFKRLGKTTKCKVYAVCDMKRH